MIFLFFFILLGSEGIRVIIKVGDYNVHVILIVGQYLYLSSDIP